MIFYSHAIEQDGKRIGTKLLKDHLREVGTLIRSNIPRTDYASLPEMANLAAISHDFGKYTSYFQDYLLSQRKESSERHHHGLISALFASHLVRNDSNVQDEYIELLAYFIVLHHHGDLRALELDVIPTPNIKGPSFSGIDEPWRSRLKALVAQIADIRKNLPLVQSELEGLMGNINVESFLDSWEGTFARIKSLSYKLGKESDDEKLRLFVLALLLYSLLIDADKRNAAGARKTTRMEIPGNLVDEYRVSSPAIDTESDTGINGIRNEIYGKAIQKISAISLDNHILALTAPTGTGKTLTSFSCALKLRERIERVKGYAPRIIYSLPFISIIDQNFKEIQKVLSHRPDYDANKSAYLIQHHHLADVRYKAANEEMPLDESLLTVEAWDSEVIVTTFIQLLHTIIGYRNRFLKKYHNIAGSIILLDEVQNIAVEYWPLINKVLKLLAKYLECYIILLTATKPLIFDNDETVELLEDNRAYFAREDLNRVDLTFHSNEIGLDEFFSRFKELHNDEESYLIVLNTIASSIKFFGMVEADDGFRRHKEEGRLFYLSTNIIPKDRAERILRIRDFLSSGKKIIIVSTQVIEAGIDIDLDVAIRDVGPLDSIIQVSGRCNRAKRIEKGRVHVFNLTGNRGSYSKIVYGPIHTNVSKELLREGSFEELSFLDLIDKFFVLVSAKKDQSSSDHIWDAIRCFRFHHDNLQEKSISRFSLIDEKRGYINLFIEKDEEGRNIWKRYITEVRQEKDFRQRERNYLAIRRDFNSYLISVPERIAAGSDVISDWLRYIPYERLEMEYKDDTGFKRTEDDGAVIF